MSAIFGRLVGNEHPLVASPYIMYLRKTLAVEASGRENKKKAAQDKVQNWYHIKCTQDEADAICLGYHVLNSQGHNWT